RRMQALLGLMVRTTIVLCPLILILWVQIRTGITWGHRAAVLVDLTLLWIFWPRIHMPVQRGESATRAIWQWTKGLISHSRKAYRTAQHIRRWMERIPFLMKWMERMETIASLPGFGMALVGHLSYSFGPNIPLGRIKPCSVRVRIDPILPKELLRLPTCHRQRSSLTGAPTSGKPVRVARTRLIEINSS